MSTHRRRPYLSQNFLHCRKLVARLIRQSSVGKNDTVLEIGPGQGIITTELIKKAKTVIAIELDQKLFYSLEQKFCHAANLKLYLDDCLRFPLPTGRYKVLANIPLAIEGKIIRRLIDSHNPPEDCYLTARKELAFRLGGIGKEGLFSVSHQPWFCFSIFYRFRQSDFFPKTKVPIVMLRITKRYPPLIPVGYLNKYQSFVRLGFANGGRLKQNFKHLIDSNQLTKISQTYKFSTNDRPSELKLNQWIEMFWKFLKYKSACRL